MGNCLPKNIKNEKCIKSENSFENNIEDQEDFININYNKLDNNLIEKYGKEKIIESIKSHWWYLRTNIKNYNELINEINKKIFEN